MLKNVDNVVLVALVEWVGLFNSQAKLCEDLKISPASLSRSLKRLDFARLVRHRDLTVIKPHAEEYLVHGLRYLFPARLGTRVRGVPTAHSAPPLSDEIASEEAIVWPAEFGKTSGLELLPLHGNIPALCIAYPEFHPVFALLDAIRIGRARERQLAQKHLARWLGND